MYHLRQIIFGLIFTLIVSISLTALNWAEDPEQVPVISVEGKMWPIPDKACKEYAGYKEVIVNNVNEYQKDEYHCIKGKPVGKQSEFNAKDSQLKFERYYDNKGSHDLTVWLPDNLIISSYKVLNASENITYTIKISPSEQDTAAIDQMSAKVECTRSSIISDPFYSFSKQCNDLKWYFLLLSYTLSEKKELTFNEATIITDNDLKTIETRSSTFTKENIKKLKDVIREIHEQENKYGTHYLEKYQAALDLLCTKISQLMDTTNK